MANPALETPTESWVHRDIELSEFTMHCVEQGEGPLVILLHGFPEYWRSWRLQIPVLAEAGFRVVVPDMRGYNTSGKPKGVAAYKTKTLARDIAELVEACGEEKAIVVGHDWGAVVAWYFAMYHPEKLEKLAILNVPHPRRMLQGLASFRQLLKSWYVFFFQLPFLPEKAMQANGHSMMWRTFRREKSLDDVMSDEDVQGYIDAMSQPGTLTSAIHYYRAAMRYPDWEEPPRIDHEVLILWGERDAYLGAELAEPDPQWVPNTRIVRIPHASHWVHLDAADQVNTELLGFLAES